MKKDLKASPSTRGNVGIGVGVVAAWLVLSLAFKHYPAAAPPKMTVGIVQSSRAHSFGKLQDGWRETATVRLADGKLVLAVVLSDFISDRPLSTGDVVTISEQPRMGEGPIYKVVARSKR